METLTVIRSGHLGPASITRAALMDLGFAGLIEKIEERFGTVVTSALLLALVLLVFAWITETIFSLYASGTKLWEESGSGAILGLVKIGLVHFILIAFTVVVIYAIFRRMQDRAIRKVKDNGAKKVDEIRKLGAEKVSDIHAVARMYGVQPKGGDAAEEKD